MNNTVLIMVFSLGALFTLSSCHQNEEVVTEIEISDPPKVTISTTHAAKVINEFGKEIKDFTANFNQQLRSSTNRGLIVFKANNINKYGERMIVTDKKGFDNNYLLSGFENTINYSVLTVFENKQKQTFGHNVSTILDIDQDVKLVPQPDSYKTKSNSYNDVIHATWYATSLANQYHVTAIPAVRIGQAKNGLQYFLNISKAFYINMSSSLNEDVECIMSIKGTLDNITKGSVKLWFCDIEAAIWKEVTTDIIENNTKFKHIQSGFYCIAENVPGIYVSGQTILNGQGISNLNLKLGKDNPQYISTSTSGYWSAFLPAQSTIPVAISAGCGDIYNFVVETSNVEMTNLKIDLTEKRSLFSQLKGKVKDCKGQNVSNYILTNLSSTNEFYYANGNNIDLWVATCDQPNVSLITSDLSGDEEGDKIDWVVTDIIETGTWFVCSQAKNPYFNLIIDGENKMYWDTKSSKNMDGRLVIQALQNGTSEIPLNIILPDNGIGEKMDNQLNILLKEKSFEGKGYEVYCPTSTQGCGFEKFVITHFDNNEDQIIRGYFKGRFWVKTLEPLTAGYKNIEGEFQVKKEY
ncbi:MAG: hypothetical protein IPN86_09020 [Saprospiraceae bacterium]|nr:hypothetical protein [Saprospiraceae bacterium]